VEQNADIWRLRLENVALVVMAAIADSGKSP
jgi:hypothetical protein